MNKVEYSDIVNMNRIYYEVHNYAEVARRTGFSASTVKRYIQPGYVPEEERPVKHYEGNLPRFDPTIFYRKDWNQLCLLSDEEKAEIKELWNEMEV